MTKFWFLAWFSEIVETLLNLEGFSVLFAESGRKCYIYKHNYIINHIILNHHFGFETKLFYI